MPLALLSIQRFGPGSDKSQSGAKFLIQFDVLDSGFKLADFVTRPRSSSLIPANVFFSCRDPTPHEFAIQVGTPKRGRIHRISAKYTAKNRTAINQSGIVILMCPRSLSLRRSRGLDLAPG